MSRNKELFKNTIIILVGKICTQLVTFFLLPIYTHFLSTGEYGTVDLITTYIGLLAPLISLQLEYAAFRYLIDARKNNSEQKKIVSNVLLSLIILSIICLVVFITLYSILNFNNGVYLFLILICTMLANMLLQVARGLGDNLGYTIGSFIAGVSNALISIFFVVILKMGIEGILLGMFISNLLCSFYLIYKERIFKLFDTKLLNKSLINKLLKYSIPMIPNSICWWIISVSDRTIISIFLGVASNGIYSVSAKFSGLIVTIYNMFNLSWTETVALHINDDDSNEYLSMTFKKVVQFFSCGCMAIISIMPFVFPILIGNSYTDAYQYIPFLILGSFFNIIMGMLSAIYIGKKESKAMAKTTIVAAIVNIIINIIFVKELKIWAAVISTIISFALVSIYRMKDIKKYINIKYEFKNYWHILIAFIIVCIIYMINNLYLNILSLIIVTIYSIYTNKSILLSVLNMIKDKMNIKPICKSR